MSHCRFVSSLTAAATLLAMLSLAPKRTAAQSAEKAAAKGDAKGKNLGGPGGVIAVNGVRDENLPVEGDRVRPAAARACKHLDDPALTYTSMIGSWLTRRTSSSRIMADGYSAIGRLWSSQFTAYCNWLRSNIAR